MDVLNPYTSIALCSDSRCRFCGIAFDGCFFYLTVQQACKIYKYKQDFTMVGNFNTDQPYHCICYDNAEKCFWVTTDKHTDVVYKLGRDMKEIGQLQLCCRKACSPIVGLSYNCEKDALLAAYKDFIVEVSKENNRTCMMKESCEGYYAAILSIAPYYAVCQQEENGHFFQIFTRKGRRIKNIGIPDAYKVRDVLLYPCSERYQDACEIMLLVTKEDCCQSFLLKMHIYDMDLCSCNYSVCQTPCREEDKSEQCICDIIESVALVETSLSHILNAEGEKLQKAVELADSVNELLLINKSVTKAIINITQLEHQLYLKLDALNDLCKSPIHNKQETK